MKKLIFNRTLIPIKTHFKEEKEFLSTLPDRFETSNPLMLDIAWEEGYEIFLLDEDKKEINIRDLTLKELRPAHNISKLYLADHFTNIVCDKCSGLFKEFGRANCEEDYVLFLIEKTFGRKYPEECGVDNKEVLNNIKYLNKIIEYCISELGVTYYRMTNGNIDVLDCKAEAERGLKEHKEQIEIIL
jgi:hypothetical protein|nr:MAG TPA: hypothetical protein [Caudoviricetes sp.]DAW57273.1 MAG TPA: hypothetical protein [Caudoviricetes sp.]